MVGAEGGPYILPDVMRYSFPLARVRGKPHNPIKRAARGTSSSSTRHEIIVTGQTSRGDSVAKGAATKARFLVRIGFGPSGEFCLYLIGVLLTIENVFLSI
jgi:hypothetical protein